MPLWRLSAARAPAQEAPTTPLRRPRPRRTPLRHLPTPTSWTTSQRDPAHSPLLLFSLLLFSRPPLSTPTRSPGQLACESAQTPPARRAWPAVVPPDPAAVESC